MQHTVQMCARFAFLVSDNSQYTRCSSRTATQRPLEQRTGRNCSCRGCRRSDPPSGMSCVHQGKHPILTCHYRPKSVLTLTDIDIAHLIQPNFSSLPSRHTHDVGMRTSSFKFVARQNRVVELREHALVMIMRPACIFFRLGNHSSA